MYTIGVTGGVGCGKSEILKHLQTRCACHVIRTDEVANAVKEPGGVCYDEIVALLGEDVLEEGRIDRAKMAAKIFADDDLLKQVNAILHPAVRRYVLERITEEQNRDELDVLFVEAALLIESGYRAILDEMWYVYAPEAVRRERLKKYRGYSDEKIDSIMAKQLPEEAFRAGTDFEINNGGAIEDAVAQAKTRLGEIL